MKGLNSERQLATIIEEGNCKLLLPVTQQSRIVLSRLKKAAGRLDSCNGYALFVPLAGKKAYTTAQARWVVEPGQYALLDHDQDCHLQVNEPRYTVGLNVRLNRQLVAQVFYTMTQRTETLLAQPFTETLPELPFFQGVFDLASNTLGHYIKTIISQLDWKSEILDLPAEALFCSLAEELILSQQKVQAQLASIPAKRKSTREELFRRVQKARSLLHDHCHTDLNIAMIARESALSEAHFLRSFKMIFGTSPHQYYLTLKMACAADQLRKTGIPVTDIAFAFGFNDLSSFSRLFKKQHGLSPVQFRRQFHNKN